MAVGVLNLLKVLKDHVHCVFLQSDFPHNSNSYAIPAALVSEK